MESIATAWYQDVWAGRLPAYLKPQRTMRRGQRMIVYRWVTDRGSPCDGVAHGHGAARMIAQALRNPFFSDVAVKLEAREVLA